MQKITRWTITPVLFLMCLVLIGCANIQDDWKNTQNTETKEAYEKFLKKYPQSEYSEKARDTLEKFTWEEANNQNTAELYKQFLTQYPNSEYAEAAKEALETLEWEMVCQKNTIAAYNNFVTQYPQSDHRKEAEMGIEQLKLIPGGCQSSMGNLEGEEEKRLHEIASLMNTSQDMKMLSELYKFLQHDPHNKGNARPLIQKILTSITAQRRIKTGDSFLKGPGVGLGTGGQFQESFPAVVPSVLWLTGDWAKCDEVVALMDYYAKDQMSPEFSYESVICMEITLLMRHLQLETVVSKEYTQHLRADKQALLWEIMPGMINIYGKNREKIFDMVVGAFENRALDGCAKKYLWEFSERLIGGGGPYYKTAKGLEANAQYIAQLKVAYLKEDNPIIREIAKRVISKLE